MLVADELEAKDDDVSNSNGVNSNAEITPEKIRSIKFQTPTE